MRLESVHCQKNKKYDFPDKKIVNDSYVHDLKKLIKVAGLELELDREMRANEKFASYWNTVQSWNEECRYSLDINRRRSVDMYNAVIDDQDGVLVWVKRYW